jgi:hypothetical protein
MQQTASFTVTPEAIPRLSTDLTDIERQIRQSAHSLAFTLIMRPLGSDATSIEAARIHNDNAKKAIAAVLEYADQLEHVVSALSTQGAAYQATEHETTAPFLNGHR